MGVGIAYMDGPRLARSLFAASDWVAAGREEINRINVFPVPDGDTGTNFSLTLRAVADALRALGDASLPATAQHDGPGRGPRCPGQLGNDAGPFPHGCRRVDRRQGHRHARRAGRRALHRGGTPVRRARRPSGRHHPDGRPRGRRRRRTRRGTVTRHRRVHAADAPRGRGGAGAHPGAHGGAQGGGRRGRRWHGLHADDRRRRAVHRRRPDPGGRSGVHRRVRRPRGGHGSGGGSGLPVLHRGRGPRRTAATRQRGPGGAPDLRGLTGRGRHGRHPQRPCAYRHPRRRLYLCVPLGAVGEDEGGGHAGPASGPAARGPEAGRHRRRQRLGPPRRRARPPWHHPGSPAGHLRGRGVPGSGRR